MGLFTYWKTTRNKRRQDYIERRFDNQAYHSMITGLEVHTMNKKNRPPNLNGPEVYPFIFVMCATIYLLLNAVFSGV